MSNTYRRAFRLTMAIRLQYPKLYIAPEMRDHCYSVPARTHRARVQCSAIYMIYRSQYNVYVLVSGRHNTRKMVSLYYRSLFFSHNIFLLFSFNVYIKFILLDPLCNMEGLQNDLVSTYGFMKMQIYYIYRIILFTLVGAI